MRVRTRRFSERGEGTKILLSVDGNVLQCGNMIESASPHIVNLIEPLHENRVIHRRPGKLIDDAAADSDSLRIRLLKRGINLMRLRASVLCWEVVKRQQHVSIGYRISRVA